MKRSLRIGLAITPATFRHGFVQWSIHHDKRVLYYLWVSRFQIEPCFHNALIFGAEPMDKMPSNMDILFAEVCVKPPAI